MNRMRIAARLTRAAGIAAVLCALPLQAQQMDGMKMDGMKMDAMKNKPMSQADMARMEPMMRDWPKASRDAVAYMTSKYGAPMVVNAQVAMWGATGQWKRTIVYNYEVQHDFPAPHTDVMQQWIDYKVPVSKYDDLAMYDGSVVPERTNGEMSARCDKEGANFLAINLAHEIATGKRTAMQARGKYAEQITAMMAMRSAPYTERIMFAPMMMSRTMDPDRPAAGMMK